MAGDKELKEALYGTPITEVVKRTKIAFDVKQGIPTCVYFDEHGEPMLASPDQSAQFIHTIEQWFKYWTDKTKKSTIKIEKANGQGFVITMVPVFAHKIKEGWFEFFMEKDGWKNKKNEYWKFGLKFDLIDEGKKVQISKNVGLVGEEKITLNAPKDEIEVAMMLELVR